MKRYFAYLLIGSFGLIVGCKTSNVAKKANGKDPIIAYLGDYPIYQSDFQYVYEKNTNNKDSAYTAQSLKEYLKLYLNFKLKVLDAKAQGVDTTQTFKAELAGYEAQLAKPYLRAKEVNEKLVEQAYERLKQEVNASHILIKISPEAEPADTLAAYKKIADIKKKAQKGEDFGQLAANYSEDPSASMNKGNLGYFTALQMVYPFEQVAYQTPVGEVSDILRTDFGYHILKVHDRRPTSGKLKVAHIMLKTAKGQSVADSVATRERIFEIYKRLEDGEPWDKLCQQFSEDMNSKKKNGELPVFSIGTIIPEFEQAAFSLEKEGEYTEPVYTAYGWHIIKLLEKVTLEPFVELEPLLTQKVSKDSRSDVSEAALISRLKEENNFSYNRKVLASALEQADTNLFTAQWKYRASDLLQKELLSFSHPAVTEEGTYTVKDFFEYLVAQQQARNDIKTPSYYMQVYFDRFVEEKAIAFEKDHLAEKHEEYRMLAKEYKEGMMLFQMMNDNVWGKAIRDTAGAREYYQTQQEQYMWKKRVKAIVYDAADEQVLKQVLKKKDQKMFKVPDFTVATIFFEKNSATIPNASLSSLNALVNYLLSDKTNKVEIGGHIDPLEKAAVAAQRIEAISNYLDKRGVNKTQIIQKNFGKYQPLSRTDRTKNRRTTFTVYATSIETLEKQFNQEQPLNLKITQGVFQKGDNDYIDSIVWKEGDTRLQKNDRWIYINIEKVEAPRRKTFEEARGYVISDYQNYLEEQWVEQLKVRYPIRVEEATFQDLVKE